MAQKKGLIYRMTMGKDNLPDYMPDRLPGSRWALFKDTFFNRFGAMAKISLLSLIFFIPLIAMFVIMYIKSTVIQNTVPYSGNIGIGYPIVSDAAVMGEMWRFANNLYTLLYMVPCAIIAFIGLAGAFHVMKLLAWGEGVSVASNFFIGIKKNILQFLVIAVFLSISIFLFAFNITSFDSNTMPLWLRIMTLVASIILFIMVMCMMIFLPTQAVTYNLKIRHLFKNSFLFAIALLPTNIFFLIVAALPFIIAAILPLQFSVFVWLILAFMGIAYVVLVLTVYAHWAYDKFVNDRVEGAIKNRGMYVKTPEDEKAAEIEALKTRNTVYGSAYISKRLSSIDQGSSFTPLETNFSRADLARLRDEKDQMKKEIEDERTSIDMALEQEILEMEAEAAAAKKKGKNKQQTAAKEKSESKEDVAYDEVSEADVAESEYVDESEEVYENEMSADDTKNADKPKSTAKPQSGGKSTIKITKSGKK